MNFNVEPLDRALEEALKSKIDHKTKPLGSLGELEALALRIGLVQNSLSPLITRPVIAVFAGDHGITEENVSAYPAEVTAQMVLNFLAGGAAINVFARTHDAELKIVDAGVMSALPTDTALIDAKIGPGTKNFLHEPAMTQDQRDTALERSAALVTEWHAAGTNVIGFGDMGIGNTSAAAVLTALFASVPIEDAVGPGAGLENAGVSRKKAVLTAALQRTGLDSNRARDEPLRVLAEYGGFEIAMICGGMLRAAGEGMLVLVDGFIATSAFLCAQALQPNLKDYCVFSHRSAEWGHANALASVGARPLLDLGMRLGEGTGAAMALPLVRCAVGFLNDMSSFADAAVSERKD